MTFVVDFYLLQEPSLEMNLRNICYVTEKCYKENSKIYIRIADRSTVQKLDDLLWIFHDISFLPHAYIKSDLAIEAPIILTDENVEIAGDILINLTSNTPHFLENFKKLLEIIPNDRDLKTKARERYRYYKKKGYLLTTHNISDIDI